MERPNKNLSQLEITYLVGTSSLKPSIIFHICFKQFKTDITKITNKTLFIKKIPIIKIPFVF